MKKRLYRLLAMLLAISLLLPAADQSAASAAGRAESLGEGASAVAYLAGGAITANGVFSEKPWLVNRPLTEKTGISPPDGEMDLLWDSQNLYLAFKTEAADTLTITANGVAYEYDIAGGGFVGNSHGASAGVSGGSAELILPFAGMGKAASFGEALSFQAVLANDTGSAALPEGLTVTLSGDIALLGDNGDSLSVKSPTVSAAGTSYYAGDYATTAGKEPRAPQGEYLFYDDGTAGNKRSYMIYSGLDGFRMENGALLEFDADFINLPVLADANRGFWFMLAGPKEPTNAQTVSCTFTADSEGKLVFRAYPAVTANVQTIATGLSAVGEYRIGVKWGKDGDLTLYIDGQYMGALSGITSPRSTAGSQNLTFNSIGPISTAPFGGLEFCIDNIRLTSLQYGSEALLTAAAGGITFDEIKGENASPQSIAYPLALPATVTLPYTGETLPVIWESGNPGVIASDGNVTPAEFRTRVTLTARLYKDGYTEGTASFSLVVPGQSVPPSTLTALLTETAVTANGTFAEKPWLVNLALTEEAGTEAPRGEMDLLWDAQNLYLAFKTSGADTLTVTANGVAYEYDIAGGGFIGNSHGASAGVSGGNVELSLPFTGMGMPVTDFGETLPFGASLANGAGSVSLPDGLTLTLSGQVALLGDNAESAAGRWTVSAAGATYYAGDAATTAAKDPRALEGEYIYYDSGAQASKRSYLLTTQVAGHEMDGETRLELDADFIKLPVWRKGDGAVGLSITLAGKKAPTDAPSAIFQFASDENGELLFIGLPASVANAKVLETGLPARGSYRLRVNARENGELTLFIDGTEIGTLTGIWAPRSSVGERSVILNAYGPSAVFDGMEFYIDNLRLSSLRYSPENLLASAAKGVTFDVIKGQNASPQAIVSPLTLPGTVVLPFSGEVLPVLWESSDTSAISASGTVTRGTGDAPVLLTARLQKEGYTDGTARFSLLVPGHAEAITHTDAYYVSAPPVLDGSFSERYWMAETRLPVETGSLAPQGRLDLLWDSSSLYVAADAAGADTLTLIVGEEQVVYSLETGAFLENEIGAQAGRSGERLELALPLAELGVAVTQFGETLELDCLLENATGSVSFGQPVTVTLSGLTALFGNSCDTLSERTATKSAVTPVSYIGDAVSTADSPVPAVPGSYLLYDDGTQPSGRRYLQYTSISGMEPADGIYLEYKLKFNSMPSYTSDYGIFGFWTWILGPKDADGFMRCFRYSISADEQGGLTFYAVGQNSAPLHIVPLGKSVGDAFTFAIDWSYESDTLVLHIDGEPLTALRFVSHSRTSGAAGFIMNIERNHYAPDAPIEIQVDSIRMLSGKYGNGTMLPLALEELTFEDIMGSNASEEAVVSTLSLPSGLALPVVDATASLSWSSGSPDVISDGGAVTRPAGNGELVYLTVTAQYMGLSAEKTFRLFVPGQSPGSRVSFLTNDLNPYTGVADTSGDRPFTMDRSYGSVVLDLGASARVNVVELRDSDSFSRVSKTGLSLYASGDNVTYERLTDWSLLKKGNTYYFYNLDVTARYIKIHCHLDDRDKQADLTGSLQDMADAYESDGLLSDGAFAKQITVTVSNSGSGELIDGVFSFTQPDLGILPGDLRSDRADIRFVMNGRLLYHYDDGERFHVRVPSLSEGGSGGITVHYGNELAMDISDGTGVYEVEYGTKTLQSLHDAVRFTGIPAITLLPDGNLIAVSGREDVYGLAKRVSQDGGRTWSAPVPIEAATNIVAGAGGFLVDEETGRVFLFGRFGTGFVPSNIEASNMIIYVMYSDDNGQTWSQPAATDAGRSYFLSYSDGIKTSVADGAGPNVDYVVPFGAQYDNTGAFCTSVLYSSDGGQTWQGSESTVTYGAGVGHEGGVSESYLIELSDGRLFMISRCQVAGVIHFVKSYSSDFGVTWVEQAVDTQVYAPNTQPVLYDLDGTPLLLWGGNNAQGGTSYQRYPLTIAYSNDDCETFVGMQDLYAGTSLMGVDNNGNDVVNPHIAQSFYNGGDDAVFTWYNLWNESVSLLVEDFERYLYLTKGAFDSFEGGNLRYEGWQLSAGNAEADGDRASAGNYSMRLDENTMVSRSIPYFTDGTLSLDLYFDDLGDGFDLELQAAYSSRLNTASPIALRVGGDGSLCFYGENKLLFPTGLALSPGWNTLRIRVDLDNGEACFSLNGGSESELPVASQLGAYVCFVNLWTGEGTSVFVDRFTVDAQPAVIPPVAPPEESVKNGR